MLYWTNQEKKDVDNSLDLEGYAVFPCSLTQKKQIKPFDTPYSI